MDKTEILVGGTRNFTDHALFEAELPKILDKHNLKKEEIAILGYEDSSTLKGAYDVAERWAAKNNVPFVSAQTGNGKNFDELLAKRNAKVAEIAKLFINLRTDDSNGGSKIIEAIKLKGVPMEVIGGAPEKKTRAKATPADVTDVAENPEPSPSSKRKGEIPAIEDVRRSVKVYSRVARKLLNSACVMLDTETTGLGDTDEVIELAILDCLTEATLVNTLVKTEKTIGAQAQKVNKITKEMLEDKPTLGEVWLDVEGMVGNRVVLASNAPFDERLINQSLKKYDLTCSFFWYDIQTLYRKYSCQESASQYPLKTIGMCQQLGLEAGTHRAKDDVKAQIRLLKAMAHEVMPNFEV